MSEKSTKFSQNQQTLQTDLSKPAGLSVSKPKKLLDQVSEALRTKHYAYRTEETYVDWIKRYILFHKKRHPNELTPSFLSSAIVSTHPAPNACPRS